MPPIIAFTGHRPKDLGPFAEDAFRAALSTFIDAAELDPIGTFVTGGALGVDSWAAQYALDHDIPLDIILPFSPATMSKFWRPWDQLRLNSHIDRARSVTILHPNGYDPIYYQRRNEAMVDRCHFLIAVWNGKRYGGTYNCLRYASTIDNLHIQNLFPGGPII